MNRRLRGSPEVFFGFRLGIVSLLLFACNLPVEGEPPVSAEWKQRVTVSLRKRIEKGYGNPFEAEIVSVTSAGNPPSSTAEASVPILSSLTSLLTQATTETLSLSREIGPAIGWPKAFWSIGESEEWSWRKRFNWFQNESRGVIPQATQETNRAPSLSDLPREASRQSSGRGEAR